MTLLSTVIPLIAANAPEESAYLGRACYAFFLSLIERVNPSLAEELHAPRGAKPFTVSALFSWEKPHLVQPEVREGERYYLRFTSIETELSRLLAEEVLPNLPSPVELGPARFDVGMPITEGHPWAGRATPEELVERWFGGGEVGKRVTLEFASPTAFRRIHRNVVVPLPAAVFRSLLGAWNGFGRPAFEQDLVDFVEAEVEISRYRLRSAAVQIGPGWQIGCIGRCSYVCFHPQRSVWRVLHLLADFALFCGVGYKTTQGMGQARRMGESGESANGRIGESENGRISG